MTNEKEEAASPTGPIPVSERYAQDQTFGRRAREGGQTRPVNDYVAYAVAGGVATMLALMVR